MTSKKFPLLLWPLLLLTLSAFTGCQNTDMPAAPDKEVDVQSDLSQDGLDNDNDGTIDEPEEAALTPADTHDATTDGVDNDNDGTIDEPGETVDDGT